MKVGRKAKEIIDGKYECCKCKIWKPIDEFHKRFRSKTGLKESCKDCSNKHSKEYHSRNRNTRIIQIKEYKNKNKDKIIEYKNLKKYGLTNDEYNNLLSQQNYVCAICKKAETSKQHGTVKRLSVDHCHKSNKVRGLLCYNCNIALGHFKDNTNILAKAIVYLEENDG